MYLGMKVTYPKDDLPKTINKGDKFIINFH